MEKRKKVDAFILFQRLLAQKIEITIDKVLQKASKIIYKGYGKTKDSRRYLSINKKKEKKKKKKNDIELFFE